MKKIALYLKNTQKNNLFSFFDLRITLI